MPRTVAAALLLSLVCLCGCPPKEDAWVPPSKKDYGRPLPPGQLALRKIPPELYPDFSRGFYGREGLETAIRHSLSYMSRPSSKRYYPYGEISHSRVVASLQALLLVLQQAQSPQDFDAAIRERFDVYQSVGCDDRGTVLYTGYYTPIFEGRKQREGPFQYPLYKAPPDLVADAEGNVQGRRTPDGRMVPYMTRREIEQSGQLEGTELAWLKSPFEAYVVTVQGSAKLRLADGSLWEIGYAGNNGHDYVPIAKAMIADGAIRAEDLSLQTLLRYFRDHPQDVSKYAWQNPRYVFFKETSGGPFGSIGVPVTSFRSVATDKQIFPRAAPAFLDTQLPQADVNGNVTQMPYGEFACDQDTGGAIRAAGRCDVYMGVGAAAESLAGRTYAEGRLYYIFLKDGGTAAR
ncbi:MAG: MltA domain-containing protein [Phycisphaerales bacterium]|nr:MltA domain-containing protein [Phycisphaerales bacterium]